MATTTTTTRPANTANTAPASHAGKVTLSLREQYRLYIDMLGTSSEVSGLLGTHRNTLSFRLSGKVAIKREHVLAVRYLCWLAGHTVDHTMDRL